jgi:hypothetical protein
MRLRMGYSSVSRVSRWRGPCNHRFEDAEGGPRSLVVKDPPAWPPDLPGFRRQTLQDCCLRSPRQTRHVHTPVLPCRHWPSGRGEIPLASAMIPPSATRGKTFTRGMPFACAMASWLLAPWADPTACPQPVLGFLRPGFQPSGSPQTTAGYDYSATRGSALAGLSPARLTTSLAAPLLGLLMPSCEHQATERLCV